MTCAYGTAYFFFLRGQLLSVRRQRATSCFSTAVILCGVRFRASRLRIFNATLRSSVRRQPDGVCHTHRAFSPPCADTGCSVLTQLFGIRRTYVSVTFCRWIYRRELCSCCHHRLYALRSSPPLIVAPRRYYYFSNIGYHNMIELYKMMLLNVIIFPIRAKILLISHI